MKIAITGHTKGIGKAIADLYPNVIGFSRSNGYDISKLDTIENIIKQSLDCDVFINNAYYNLHQTVLFEKLLTHWFNNGEKTIVNINSKAKYNSPNGQNYGLHKKELYAASLKAIRNVDRKCRVININPGYVKTDRVMHLADTTNMLTPDQLGSMIKWCIDQPQGIEIGELSVWCTTL